MQTKIISTENAPAAIGTYSQAVQAGNVFLTDLANFGKVNAAMEKFFQKPYPARAAVQVSKLPKDALVEADAIAVVD